MRYRLTGPKGGLLVRAATAKNLGHLVAGYAKRFKRVTVSVVVDHRKPLPTVREKIVANARWGVRAQAQIHYAETRPIAVKQKPHTLPLTTDCSGFATLCYLWAGAPDPNGLGYDGSGYTGTLLDHGKVIPRQKVQPGDLVVYGPGTGHHVAIVVDNGPDPLTVSHGQEAGPLYIHVSEEQRYQPPGVRYLSFLP